MLVDPRQFKNRFTLQPREGGFNKELNHRVSKIWYLKKKTKLDDRLQAVAQRIHSNTHVDVGSDHGKLLLWLLKHGRIKRGIAIEVNELPFQNSVESLRVFFPPRPVDGSADGIAEVRLGDGLEPLQKGEADSLTICGLGGSAIARILNAHPDRVPNQVLLQPNNRPEAVRRWALRNRFRLLEEVIIGSGRDFIVLSFERDPEQSLAGGQASFSDPAYQGVDLEEGILFGPLVIKQNPAVLAKQLDEELAYWSQFSQLKKVSARRLAVVKNLKASLSRVSLG